MNRERSALPAGSRRSVRPSGGRRDAGRELGRAACDAMPLDIGVPGAVDVGGLARFAARIGVADPHQYLNEDAGPAGELIRRQGFRPNALLERLARLLAERSSRVRDLHVYTFNEIEATELWRRGYIASLGSIPPG